MPSIRTGIDSLHKALKGKAGSNPNLIRDWVGHFNDMEKILLRLDPETPTTTPEQKKELATHMASTNLTVKDYLKQVAPKILKDLNDNFDLTINN